MTRDAAEESISRDILFVLGCVVLGLLLRCDFLIANNYVIDADEAIVGLMARDILRTGSIPVFYYGQAYMGSLEPMLAAVSFAVLGVSSFSLKLIPLLFSIALIPLVYCVCRSIASPFAGRCAALLIAVPASPLVVWSAKARGGFIELIVIGTCALLLSIRWLKKEPVELLDTIFIALLLGVGWWVNNQIVYFMLPIGFVMLARFLHARAFSALCIHGCGGLLAFILGGLPFWLYNLRYSFESFAMLTGESSTSFVDHFWGAFGVAVPILFGGKRFWQSEDLFPGASLLVWILLGTALLWYAWKRRGQIAGLFLLKIDRKAPQELLLLFVFACFSVFILSSFGYLYQAPRYLLPVYVGVYGLVAVGLSMMRRSSALLILSGILAVNIASLYFRSRAIPGEPFVHKGERVSKDHSQLISWLKEKGITKVQTNYWIGYRLVFETEEFLTFRISQAPYHVRIPRYESTGDDGILPYVLVPSQAQLIERALELEGYQFDREVLSGYVVLWNIRDNWTCSVKQQLSPTNVHASDNNETAMQMIDGDIATRWGTGKPQAPGMSVRIQFATPTEICGIEYAMGRWRHDYPRGLRIRLAGPGGEETLIDEDDFRALQYFEEADPNYRIQFTPRTIQELTLLQTGSDELFDWSLAELSIFGPAR